MPEPRPPDVAGAGAAPVSAPIPAHVVDEAVAWAVRIEFGEPDARTRQAFAAWLQAAPVHAAAWRRVGRLGEAFARVPGTLAAGALSGAHGTRGLRSAGRRQALKTLALAGVAVGAGWGLRDTPLLQRAVADHHTGVGERRRVAMSAGASIDLNTDSALAVDPGGDGRRVRLHRGEVRIATAADGPAPPFQLWTRYGRVLAPAARFTVRLESDRARVDVQAGQVRLLPRRGLEARDLSAGQAAAMDGTAAAPAPVRGFSADGWVDGVLRAGDATLSEVVAELARHRPGVVRLAPGIGSRRISGVFHLDDTDAALRLLAAGEGLSLRYRTRYWVSLGTAETA